MRLLLVRHGQTPSNVLHRLDTTVPGPGLTALGERQAAAVPAALAGERVEAVWASTQRRAQLTAAPLAHAVGVEVQVRDGLREISAGDLEMRSDEQAAQLYMRTIFAWAVDPDLRMPGGESGTESLARYDAVVAEVAASGVGTAVLVSHGAAIRMWAGVRVTGVAFAGEHPLSNTGAVVVTGDPAAGWHLESWRTDPLGGPAVTDPEDDGPAAEPVDPAVDPAVATEEGR